MGKVTGINDRKNMRGWDNIRAGLDEPKPAPKPDSKPIK